MNRRAAIAAAVAVLFGLTVYRSAAILACPEECLLDYVGIHGPEVGNFELPDARLNSWILGWVQHSLATDPARLFDANAFFPARDSLAGSEHMIGNALLTSWVRLFSDSAIALHQTAMVLSFAMLGLAVFGFVHWAGGSVWAALIAAVAAMFMPWRYSEVSHLQLLSAQWMPLGWWLTIRVLTRDGSRFDALWLSIALTFQLLTSFYLAYFTLFSGACLVAAVGLQTRPPLRVWIRLGAAYALPAALLIGLALPYLGRYSAYRFASPEVIPESTPPSVVLRFLAPSWTLLGDTARLAEVSYYIPLVVFGLALLPFVRIWRTRSATRLEAEDARSRIAAFGLLAVAFGAFLLSFGRQLAVGDVDVPMLGTLLAKTLPGFSQMRAEFRWGIIIGLAFPLLAGLGIAGLGRTIGPRRLPRVGVNLAIAGAVALNTPWLDLPTGPAWAEATGIRAAHQALAGLPAGTVVELPWGFKRIHIASYGSRYMLGSSFHWNPILNGYTAYPPKSHFFLQRIAGGLPTAQALAALQRLTDLRWIIVHPQKLGDIELARWDRAAEQRRIELVFSEPEARIYRVPERPDEGIWLEALASGTARERTFAGLSRAALAESAGELRVAAPAEMKYLHDTGIESWVQVEIHNRSGVDWAGFDIQTEGLVELRYRFIDADGAVVHDRTAALDIDIPAGQTAWTRSIVLAPAREGRFRVRFDLVQRIGDSLRPLSVEAVERPVEVRHAGQTASKMRSELERRNADPTRNTSGYEADD